MKSLSLILLLTSSVGTSCVSVSKVLQSDHNNSHRGLVDSDAAHRLSSARSRRAPVKPLKPSMTSPPTEQHPRDKLPYACLNPIHDTPSARRDLSSSALQRGTLNQHDRGVFWWSLAGHQYSVPRVLASPRLTRSLLKVLRRQDIKRVYTFAQPLLSGRRARQLQAWHRSLHRAQLSSYLLVGSPEWACDPRELLGIIEQRFKTFQSKSTAEERFDGVYLDLEPHALRAEHSACLYHWDQLGSSQKRALLYGLLTTVIKTRDLLQDTQTKSTQRSIRAPKPKLIVYLPSWIDHLHTRDRLWVSSTQRDDFYRCLGQHADEITIAAYCRSGVNRISQSVQTEVNLLGSKLRVGLNVYHLQGSDEVCQTWSSLEQLFQLSDALKRRIHSVFHTRVDIDLENLTRLLDLLKSSNYQAGAY